MSKEDSIEVTGTIVEKFPAGLFSVQLDQERTVLAHLAGKLNPNGGIGIGGPSHYTGAACNLFRRWRKVWRRLRRRR